jgi:spore coat-associated protein N
MNRRRSFLAAGVVCMVLGAMTLRAAALFDGAASVSHSSTAANLTLSTSGSDFSSYVEGLLPAAAATRAITLAPDGTGDIGSVKLTTTATVSSLLDTDADDGLQVRIDRCSQAWDGSEDAYTCGGSTSEVLDDRSIIMSAVTLGNVDVSAGAHNYLVVTITLSATADASFENLASTIQFMFVAQQRTPGPR